MTFFESLRLAIALGLTIFLVLLRFDSDRIMRSDYFRYRTPWMGPVSYHVLVIGFALGIALILPSGREQLFLTGGDPETVLPITLAFVAVALLNGVWPRLRPLRRHSTAADRAAADARHRRGRERHQRGAPVPLHRARHAAVQRLLLAGLGDRDPGRSLRLVAAPRVARARLVLRRSARWCSAGRPASRRSRQARSSRPSSVTSR